jgi:hypothetical protein
MKNALPQTVELHSLAPPKPDYGAPCNGCGGCCAAGPCPVAHVFLFQIKGQCKALLWRGDTYRYMCGMVVCPDHYMSLIPEKWRERCGRFFASRIAVGLGCDFAAEIEDLPESSDSQPGRLE